MKKLPISIACIIMVLVICVISCKKNNKKENPINETPPTEVRLGDSILVNFPVGSIGNSEVSLKAVFDDQSINRVFDEAISIYKIEQRLPYAIVINIGEHIALNDSISMEITIPNNFKVQKKPTSGFEIFAQIYQDGEMETLDDFVLVESSYYEASGVIKVNIPRAFFTNSRTKDKTYEAILILGITPGENISEYSLKKNSAIQDGSVCKGQPLYCPLGSLEQCTDWYPKLTERMKFGWRIHPVLKYNKLHKGVDFPVSSGTPVYSARDGKILNAISNHPDAGNFIEIESEDKSITRYLHLSEIIVKEGKVTAGQLIRKSGNTGRSTNAHLHFEYILNGQINKTKTPVDPSPCIQNQNSQGSITVSDNGNWADDAFEVYLNNILIGKTDIGASNTLAANNLRPGTKSLTLKCIVAPDNDGTYEVILNDGLTFLDGSLRREGIIRQGELVSWDVVIPNEIIKKNNSILMKRNKYKEK